MIMKELRKRVGRGLTKMPVEFGSGALSIKNPID